MKVHVEPQGLFSPAMVRIANALKYYAPDGVKFVSSRAAADLQVLYVISTDAIDHCKQLLDKGGEYVIIQCCMAPSICPISWWYPMWKGARVVVSYYDLHHYAQDIGFRFLHTPLGIDSAFLSLIPEDIVQVRRPLIVTCGRVSGPGAEPIEQVWQAARLARHRVTHIGPRSVQGIRNLDEYANVVTFEEPNDERLADIYRKASWVAALRHVEGFEMVAVEGLSCGARPVMFSQPTMMHWYRSLAAYVDECHDYRLVRALVSLLETPRPVTPHECRAARARFDWSTIAPRIWDSVQRAEKDGMGTPFNTTATSNWARRHARMLKGVAS